MINVPVGVILMWLGANGAIPAGFVRETALDGKYPKGANGGNQNTTGGAANHSHTSPTHTHDIATHSHDYLVPTIVNPNQENRLSGNGATQEQHHTHSGNTGNNATPGTTGPTAATYGNSSNEPPYTEVIFIKGDGATPIPDGVIALSANSSIPANFSIPAALKNRYFKGAAAAGDGGAQGGSYTNTHDLTHGHGDGTHGHGTNESGFNQPRTDNRNVGNWVMAPAHTHFVTPASTAVPVDNFAGNLVPAEVVEPLYRKLVALQKAAGGDLVPGLIGLWLGSIATIPAGWNLCDGLSAVIDMRDMHLKGANDVTEVASSGGSNTHAHAAQSHSHTASAHTHAVGQLGHYGGLDDQYGGGSNTLLRNDALHAAFNVNSVTANYQASNTTADASNNEPPYKTVHFIMYNKTYKQIAKTFSYMLRQNRQITKPFSYRVRKSAFLSVPFEYDIRKVIWKKIAKPDFP